MEGQQPQRRIDRILSDDYLDALDERSTNEIRSMRDAAEEEETGVSYARRVLHGRLDIIRAELLRRSDSGSTTSATLLDRLPEILADDRSPNAPRQARAPRHLVPPHLQNARRAIDRVADEQSMTRLEDRSDDELRELTDQLAAMERELSAQRRLLFDRIDRLQEELIGRYKSGAASVADILSGRT